MTREQLNEQIDTDITDVVAENGITPNDVGTNMKDIVNLRNYKLLIFSVVIDGTTVTPTYFVNDFADETITMTIPSNGKLRIAITNNVLTFQRTQLVTGVVDNANTPYFLLPDFSLLPIQLDINIKRWDNDQSGTPGLGGQFIEIRVYDNE